MFSLEWVALAALGGLRLMLFVAFQLSFKFFLRVSALPFLFFSVRCVSTSSYPCVSAFFRSRVSVLSPPFFFARLPTRMCAWTSLLCLQSLFFVFFRVSTMCARTSLLPRSISDTCLWSHVCVCVCVCLCLSVCVGFFGVWVLTWVKCAHVCVCLCVYVSMYLCVYVCACACSTWCMKKR